MWSGTGRSGRGGRCQKEDVMIFLLKILFRSVNFSINKFIQFVAHGELLSSVDRI